MLATALAAQCAVALQRVRMTEALIEGEKMRQELELARVVQMSTLPATMPMLPGYDCSGSVSYVLRAAGGLSSPLDSGSLMSWGSPGKGRWITVYAHGGHTFMTVNGRRFDTSGREQQGSRWQPSMRSTAGYVVRHPPGL